MQGTYPPHLLAHAEPSAATYHVHCPECTGPVGGAWAGEVAPGVIAIRCPHCNTRQRGFFAADALICFGPYSGRLVSSLRTEAERDYLDYLLHTDVPLGAPNHPLLPLRVAILWELGWLSDERRHVAAGPNLGRLRANLQEWLRAEAARAEQAAPAREQPYQRAREARQASWVRQMQAEQERTRGGGPRRQQQFHQYQRPQMPQFPPLGQGAPTLVAEQPGWALVLEVRLPVSARQVREAYRRLSRANHPDRGGKTAKMQQINLAHDEAQKWLALVSN